MRKATIALAVCLGVLCAAPGAHAQTVFTSGNHVQTWDPILPAQPYNDWGNTVCKPTPAIGPDAAWQNPHNAFSFGTNAHPWQPGAGFSANWINAWSNLGSRGPGGHSWTKYSTQVSGNGQFVLNLLADNCSWVYIDGELAGFQDASLHPRTYPLTLSGPHTLEFIIFDGGGLAGGMYRLETNTGTVFPDTDKDGLTDAEEKLYSTNPKNPDTDGDGVSDGDEVAAGTNPAFIEPKLIGHWTFDDSSVPEITGNWSKFALIGNATIANGALTVTGAGTQSTGWMRHDGYTGPTVTDKTMVSWVTLNDLNARAGSPLGLNKFNGDVFDSIVWGEVNDYWIPGSDFFRRTSWSPAASDKMLGNKRQIAISYRAIKPGAQELTVCLNGVPLYSYVTGVEIFDPKYKTFAVFGPRHTTSAGEPLGALNATIDEARIYDGAMTCGQVGSLKPAKPVKKDTTAPVIAPTVTGTLVNGWYTSNVDVSWSVTDPESPATSTGCDAVTVSSDTSGTTFTCSATSQGGTSSESVTIKRDTTGPSISSTSANAPSLWPPNHTMRAITVTANASDAGSGGVVCSVDGVSSNEGGNEHEPDVQLTGAMTLNLRAERDGGGAGRVYTIQVSCKDAVGNKATSSTTVSVLHDQGKKGK